MRFDYLNDAAPDAFDRIRRTCNDAHARAILRFLAASAVVVCCAWLLGEMHVREARDQRERARALLDRNAAAVVKVKAEIAALRHWTDLDRRVRGIKVSGAESAAHVTKIARILPEDVWLTSLRSGDDLDLMGRAIGLGAMGSLLSSAPAMRLVSVRATGGNDHRVLSFHASLPKE